MRRIRLITVWVLFIIIACVSLIHCSNTSTTENKQVISEGNDININQVNNSNSPFFINVHPDCYYCGSPTFVNMMKSGDCWRHNGTMCSMYDPGPLVLDENGWITYIPPGDTARTYLGPVLRSGRYVVSWNGEGNFWMGSLQSSMTPGNLYVTASGTAPYFGNASYEGFDGKADNWDLDALFNHLETIVLPEVFSQMNSMNTELTTRSVPLIAYEGGQHLAAPAGQVAWNTLYIAANKDPHMGNLYTLYYDGWKQYSSGGYFTIYSSIYMPSLSWGSWGLKETLWQPDAEDYKYSATLEWAELNPVWW